MPMRKRVDTIVNSLTDISLRLLNRLLNSKAMKRKVFCIGLHKTGTTTLYELAKKYGYRATHSTDWIFDPEKLKRFNFFSDGGSQFDDLNEFDFQGLFYAFPDSLFILQTRDAREWVISKLRHIGWNKETPIAPDDDNKIKNNEWMYKSLLTIDKFIEHKYNYENKVVRFFEEHDPSRLLIIDITNSQIHSQEFDKLITFLGLRSISEIRLPHENKTKVKAGLSEKILDYIDERLAVHNATHI